MRRTKHSWVECRPGKANDTPPSEAHYAVGTGAYPSQAWRKWHRPVETVLRFQPFRFELRVSRRGWNETPTLKNKRPVQWDGPFSLPNRQLSEA